MDLADEGWRAVRLTPSGWSIITNPPVKFVRKRGMFALPEPLPGGGVDELRALVNLPDDDAWILFVAWLVAALRPGRPFPILAVNGEQGSAKSTVCRIARALIDPNQSPLRRPPRDERDLQIAAANSHIVGYDNVSGTPPLADALCALATGGGFGTRELYTNDGETLFDAMRPILLNGIDDVATRSDLLDRAVYLTLPAIPEAKRRSEAELWSLFEECRPRILGALLDAVSCALRTLPSVRLDNTPRMADFAQWGTAAESALGWRTGTFLTAYRNNRLVASEQALESVPVVPALLDLMNERDAWVGTATELLEKLEILCVGERTRRRAGWPSIPNQLSRELKRVAPNLRNIGVDVNFGRDPGGNRRRVVRIERRRITPSPSSRPSQTLETPAGQYRDDEARRREETHQNNGTRDDWDGRDDALPVAGDDGGEEVMEWTA